MQARNAACYGVKGGGNALRKRGFPEKTKGGLLFEDFKAKEGAGGFPVVGYDDDQYAAFRITAAAVDYGTRCQYTTVDGEEISTYSEVSGDASWTTDTLTNALTAANTAHDGQTVYIKMETDVTGDNYGKTINFTAASGNTVFDLNGHKVDGNSKYR